MEQKQTKTSKTPKKKALSKPDVFREFVIWMSVIEPLRKPKTQQEFAQKFGVSPDTLTDWKKRDDLWQGVKEEQKTWALEKTANIMAKFYQKIMQSGRAADFKLWFQYFLGWNERNETEIDDQTQKLEELSRSIREIMEKKYDEPNEDNAEEI